MEKIFLAFLIISGLSHSQIQRFTYEYKFIPDSTNKTEVVKEMMLLDIDDKGSNYYSYGKYVSDSINRAELEKQIKAGSGNINIKRSEKPGTVQFSVTKEYPDYKVFLHQNLGPDSYKISETEKPDWKILPEKEKIGAYNTQKATTNFGGRSWTAWFSTDLPFPDGPYKFYGLPGLIVKIEDKTGSFVMTLVGNKKATPMSDTSLELNRPGFSFGFDGKEISATEDQFKKIWKSYLNDPAKNMREMMMKNSPDHKVVVRMTTPDGREITDMNEVYRNMEKRVKEREAKNNNKIEPSLYK